MSTNWGNDFIAAYLGGVKTRMAREQQAFEQKQILDRAPLEKARIQAEIDSANAHRDAMNAEVAAHAENYKAQVRNQFLSGARTAPGALQNPQMPGMQSQQPMSAGDQLQQSGVDPRILAVLAAHGAIQGGGGQGQDIPQLQQQPDFQSTAQQPTTFQPQQSYLQQLQTPQPSSAMQQPQIPQQTQDQGYTGTSAPSSDQFVQADSRMFPGGYAKIEGVPSQEEIDTKTFKDAVIAAKAAGLKAGTEAAAKSPYDILKEQAGAEAKTQGQLKVEGVKSQTQKDIEAAKEAATSALEDKKTKAAMAQTLAHVSGQITAANIAAASRRYVADHRTSTALDPEAITDAAMQSATGHGPPPSSTNIGLAQRKVFKDLGLVQFDPKDAEKLKAVNDVNVLYDTMLEHVNGMPEGKLGALVDRVSAKLPGTDASLFRDSVFGKAANISHTYGGEIGRLSDPDVARAMGTLAVPGITKQEAINRLNTMKLESSSKVLDHILGGQNPKQQLMNLEGYGFDPEKFVIRGKNRQLFKKFEKNPQNGTWEVYDPKTSSYLPVN